MNAPISESIICEPDAPAIFFVLDKDSGDMYASEQFETAEVRTDKTFAESLRTTPPTRSFSFTLSMPTTMLTQAAGQQQSMSTCAATKRTIFPMASSILVTSLIPPRHFRMVISSVMSWRTSSLIVLQSLVE